MTSHTYDSTFYYFVSWAEGGKIDRGARIHRALSRYEMISRMQDYCADGIEGYVEGTYGDCWAKLTRAPTEDDFERWSDEYGLPRDAFIVRAPGTHPGGNIWWVDVAIPVYAPVFKVEE